MRMLEEWPGDTLLIRLWRQRREAVSDARSATGRLATAEAEIAVLRARVETALIDCSRMSVLLLACGEMTAQERRTARAVAGFVSQRVRAAMAASPKEGSADASR